MGSHSGSTGRCRRAAVSAIIAAAALIMAGCGSGGVKGGGGGSGGGGGGTILIGGVGPLSQPGAVQAGQDMEWAMQTAVSDLNAKGGLLSKKVVLDFEDTRNLPDVAAAVAKKLVEDKHVVGVAGEYHSGSALAQIPEYDQHKTPVVFAETWNDAITAGDPSDPSLPSHPPTVFRIAPASSYVGSMYSTWVRNGLHAKNVVELYEATDFGQGQAEALKQGLAHTGIKLTQIKVELNQPDYSAILTRVKQQNPSVGAVIFDVTGESSYTIEENAFSTGLLHPGIPCLVDQVAQDSQAYWRAVPDGVGCAFQYIGPVPSQLDATAKSLGQRYQRKFGNAAKVWVYEAYDSVMILADAIKKAGSTDGMAIAKALEKENYHGALGTISFPYGSANPVPPGKPAWLWHQWPSPPIQLLEYTKKGQTVTDAPIVWPQDRQTAGTAYVKPGT